MELEPIILIEEMNDSQQSESFSWTVDATELLLAKIKSKYERLYSKKEKRSVIYDEICYELLPMIPNITAKVIETKWRNMKARFLKYEENKRTAGRRRQRPSMFYERLSDIIIDRPFSQNKTGSPYIKVSGVAENGEDTDSENVLKVIKPIKKPLKRLIKPLNRNYQVVKVIKEVSSENKEKLDEIGNVIRRTNQEFVVLQKRILKDNERRTNILENILEQMTKNRHSLKADDTAVLEKEVDGCKETRRFNGDTSALKIDLNVDKDVIVKTEYDDIYVTTGIDTNNLLAGKDDYTDTFVYKEGCSMRHGDDEQEDLPTGSHIPAPTSSVSSHSLDTPILHRSDVKLMFNRLWSDYRSVKCHLNINDLTDVANATYDFLTEISVVQLSLTREEHARVWRTLIYKRTLDLHSTSHSSRLDVQDDLLVPRPLADMLYAIGQWRCKADGVVYDTVPPILPSDRPSWTTLDKSLLTSWSQMYARLQDDYVTMKAPRPQEITGLPLMLAAFQDHGNMRTVKAQYNDVNTISAFLVFIWNRLFEPQVVTYERCHLGVNHELTRQKLMTDYVASYRKSP